MKGNNESCRIMSYSQKAGRVILTLLGLFLGGSSQNRKLIANVRLFRAEIQVDSEPLNGWVGVGGICMSCDHIIGIRLCTLRNTSLYICTFVHVAL